MDDQLKLFKEYKQKIKAIAGEKIAEEIISKSYYLIITGAETWPIPISQHHLEVTMISLPISNLSSDSLQNFTR